MIVTLVILAVTVLCIGAVLTVSFPTKLLQLYQKLWVHKKLSTTKVDDDKPVYRQDIPRQLLDTGNPDLISIFILLTGDELTGTKPLTLDDCRELYNSETISEYIKLRNSGVDPWSSSILGRQQESAGYYATSQPYGIQYDHLYLSRYVDATSNVSSLAKSSNEMSDEELVNLARSSYFIEQQVKHDKELGLSELTIRTSPTSNSKIQFTDEEYSSRVRTTPRHGISPREIRTDADIKKSIKKALAETAKQRAKLI